MYFLPSHGGGTRIIMEKKISIVTYVIQLSVIMLFFCILCFPLALMALDGPDDYDPEIFQETEASLLPLTPQTYLDGSFHTAFETWFSKHYPWRATIVSTYKEMTYSIENSKPAISIMTMLGSFGSAYVPEPSTPVYPDLPSKPSEPGVTPPEGEEDEVVDPMAIFTDPSNIYAEINKKRMAEVPVEPVGFKGSTAVYIGKTGYLYEAGYINDYYGYGGTGTNVTQESVNITAERLAYIQKELLDRYGIVMLFNISPSKAAEYTEFIPDHYKNRYVPAENYTRPVDKLRVALEEYDVTYLDGSAYYKQIGLLATFTKTGIHWNHVASFESTAQLLRMYSEISGRTIRQPEAVGVIESPTPLPGGSSDVDIYNILYGAMGDVPGKIMDEAYYYPEVEVKNQEAKKLNVLVQGCSFASDIVYHLTANDLANVKHINYNSGWNANANPWKQGIYAWEIILEGLDLIIFEFTEPQVGGAHATGDDWETIANTIGHNAVYDSLYMFLKDTE